MVPPEGYFEEMQAVARRHDILLIADEVICGFGRTGDVVRLASFGIDPTSMTVAKGLTSGYMPIVRHIVSERVWQVMLDAVAADGRLRPRFHLQRRTRSPPRRRWRTLDIIESEDLLGQCAP